ncbi:MULTISPECIES: Na+/H+ antiporter subunit E [Brachybacterium]|uniref:Multisubunit Na+/H+ antiporter MnhE subunit n=1 Tax=Brachybacterium fresconis TaxID=173363 RepID=A0ABS4YKL6_9MICO|nr:MULTISPECIES: Na+/H+ antiporter subunit E [Brachybacterium]MBP2409342.1 multisubunit Na+/H+ antiporter MnhE subunit [Brachybacterium fresconis]MDN5686704.1 Na+/H+ antiporter subunit E [Brachybacterium sp.]
MSRLWYLVSYVSWIVGEILRGSVAVAAATYSRRDRTSPAIVEYRLRAETDLEITAMASSITITPGTLVVGTAHGTLREPASLFVHAVFAEGREQVVADLTEMEDRLLRATRGRHGAEGTPISRRNGPDEEFADGHGLRLMDEYENRGEQEEE